MTAVLPPRTDLYQHDVVSHWIHLLHGRSDGFVWVGSTNDFRGRVYNTADPDQGNAAARYVDSLDLQGAAGIYLRTTSLRHSPDSGRGSDTDSLTLPGVAADLDIAGPGHKTGNLALPLPPDQDAAEAVVYESGLLTPSVWVHSGGGLYAWWLLDTPHRIADTARAGRFTTCWQNILKASANRLGWHYGPVGDLSRILRIPGTVNRKIPDQPTPCKILTDTGRRYTLANLHGALQDALAALPPEPVRERPKPRRTTDDGVSPGDAFETVDWADILQPHGWTLACRKGQVRYWCRPGKERREGHSASTGRASDRDRLWVFSDATGLPQHQPLTKFAAVAWLEHGGNFSDAARALRRNGYGSDRGQRRAA